MKIEISLSIFANKDDDIYKQTADNTVIWSNFFVERLYTCRRCAYHMNMYFDIY